MIWIIKSWLMGTIWCLILKSIVNHSVKILIENGRTRSTSPHLFKCATCLSHFTCFVLLFYFLHATRLIYSYNNAIRRPKKLMLKLRVTLSVLCFFVRLCCWFFYIFFFVWFLSVANFSKFFSYFLLTSCAFLY